ncbi:related to acetate regulatory DNA binding protein FacB [Rhynchosporium secalis]|uniref:Related to acetate regulatory DNA binding protein FacB n=1 Tax=Rhynchosporium secalis TaxID=38038 RepID=A0A1E1M791_RHYSE|nr:related to acetate regulatory DNA binding protein FacB [Rhynchosporium secalis]
MDIPPPESKRPRLAGPPPTSWQNAPDRQLPSLPATAQQPLPPPLYQQQHPGSSQTPFSRPPEQYPVVDHRRPLEHPPYDHQDPRRPGSGPMHGYHNGLPGPLPPPLPPGVSGQHPQIPPYAGQRDPMVKRAPSDEPQQYRPSSTGADHNVIQSPHHEGPGRPYPAYDPARNAQYPAPPQPSNPYPPVQSPISATEPYGNNPYGHPSPSQNPDYRLVTYPSAGRQDVKKKAQRAAQACDSCRNLKAKCDEGRPLCSTCKEKGFPCHYRDPPPKQQDKASADIMDGLARLENMLGLVNSRIDRGNTKLEQLSGEVSEIKNSQKAGVMANNSSHEGLRLKNEMGEGVPGYRNDYPRPSIGSEALQLHSNESPYGSTPDQQRAPDGLPNGGETSEEDEESGDPGPGKPSSIPVNHTTGAARLLSNTAIRLLCEGTSASSKITKNDKYPILREGRRGLLRLYGRGEGYEAPPGYERDPLVDHGPDSTPSDSHSDVSSPAGEEWGQLGGLTPPSHQPELISRGGIDSNGMPDFSRETVLDLVKSYMEHINILHPILIKSRLDLLVEHFLRGIPDSQAKPKQVSNLQAGHTSYAVGFLGSGNRNPESPGNKRKRSPVAGEYAEPHAMLDHKPGHPFRSIGSAIVLLVLALGKICQHKGKIPDAWQTDRDMDYSYGNSPTIRNGQPPSPVQSSPGMSIVSIDGERGRPRSRRTSVDGAYPARIKTRNLDVIPGLAYHALATDILGNQIAGNSLQHVHANILAGLYHGQLARVMESHGYIAAACRSLQVILRPKFERLKRAKHENAVILEKDNPLVIAFWSCLQLESDILAELPCPHSGILTYEEDMPYPHLQTAVDSYGLTTEVMESYMGQLFLRKHLNQLHHMFYHPETADPNPAMMPKSKFKEHFPTIDAALANLRYIGVIAAKMQWDATKGESATNILEARLRAKYYGAEVITYRHFVLKLLGGEEIAPGYLPKIEAPMVSSNIKRIEDIDEKVLQYAERGIRALIFSTRAFYGLGDPGKDRLIVTNIWGTAHAQWGNVVTLCAAYKNSILKQIILKFISEEGLRGLIDTTLSFLHLIATPTSALSSDYRILKRAAFKAGLLGHMPSNGPTSGSSFSSSNTGDIEASGY